MLRRFRAWLAPGQETAYGQKRSMFFSRAMVVLDANVLLDLYRYTQDARVQVLAALRLIADQQRLWLPHQVGLEFVRNRANAVKDRQRNLRPGGLCLAAGCRGSDFQSRGRRPRHARSPPWS